ncbi:MAG: Asp-tRNA(Asn)/Glu-tRNA(Gln) amidotransferase subunit GatA [Bacteroidota bacterium]
MKTYDTLSDIQQDMQARSLTCRDLVDFYLERIAAHQHLNLFTEVYPDAARQAAEEVDRKVKAGTAGPLAGLILSIKDVICHEGHSLGASSDILGGFESLFTATALQRLLDLDAIVIGRNSCDEFAMGSSNENAAQGPARNPLDSDRVPGGSSGASAAAVAANLCHAALGSDTGGSVRQPASFCGVVGAKPTYGTISRYGLIAYASSFDQIGPITRSTADARLLLTYMSGYDPHDQTSSHTSIQIDSSRDQEKPLRIGYFPQCLRSKGLAGHIQDHTRTLIQSLSDSGHTLKALDFPLFDYLVPCYYILTAAEASANLSRYDGVRYGFRKEHVQNLEEMYTQSRSEGFGPEVKRRIMLGTFVLSSGYHDAYYTQAQRVRKLIQEKTWALFDEVDVILSPTSPTVAFEIGEKKDPVQMYLSDIFTVHANLAGVPAVSIPMGKNEAGLPYGLQLMGAPFEEGKMLDAVENIDAILRK